MRVPCSAHWLIHEHNHLSHELCNVDGVLASPFRQDFSRDRDKPVILVSEQAIDDSFESRERLVLTP